MKRNSVGLAAILAISFLAGAPAHAVLVLKQVQVSGGNQIELLFDREVDVKSIKTEFYQDIIQLSLNNVSVYPPKIFPVRGSDVSKVFAYQYTPKLVRCRLTMKGKAEDFKSRIVLRSKGRSLTLSIGPAQPNKDQLITQAAKAVAAPSAPAKKAEKDGVSSPAAAAILKPEDKETLEKVLRSEGKGGSEASAKSTTLTGSADRSGKAPAKTTTMSRLARTFAWMTFVLILVAAALVGLRKLARSKNGSRSWLMRALKGKLGGQGRLIEVEATHYLGPKKSIAVVRVQGRRLVLGITDESINLITQLGESDSDEISETDLIAGLTGQPAKPATPGRPSGAGATAAGPGRFADILASTDARPAYQSQENAQRLGSVRDQIRRRVEGLKNL